jgi:glutathione S-transferase
MAQTTLWYIEISHYSEKVRWALDHKAIEHERRAPTPGYHIALALALTGGRHHTLPILELDGRRIGDSTAIIAALEERYPEPPLYPAAPGQRRRALELEDWFDEELGPYLRRFAFHELRRDRALFAELAAEDAPRAVARFRRTSAAYARALTALRFGAGSDRAANRARGKGARRARPPRGRARGGRLPGQRTLHRRRSHRRGALLPPGAAARGPATVRAARVVRALSPRARRAAGFSVGRGDVSAPPRAGREPRPPGFRPRGRPGADEPSRHSMSGGSRLAGCGPDLVERRWIEWQEPAGSDSPLSDPVQPYR